MSFNYKSSLEILLLEKTKFFAFVFAGAFLKIFPHKSESFKKHHFFAED
jgi:hypothetical protein